MEGAETHHLGGLSWQTMRQMPPAQKQARLQVRKIPLDYVPIIHKPNFPPMPILYLELVENKKKVRPELRNKDYVPRDITAALGPSLMEAEKITVTETFRLDDPADQKTVSGSRQVKLSDAVGKTPKGKKTKGPIGIIDLSKMSADEIAKMADQKERAPPITDGGTPSFKGAKSTKNQPEEDDGFPQSGPRLDEEYQKSQLFGKQEALSRLSKQDSQSREIVSRRDRNRNERDNRGDRSRDNDKSDDENYERRGIRRDDDRHRRNRKEYFVEESSHEPRYERDERRYREDHRDDHNEPRESEDKHSSEDESASKKDGLAAIMAPAAGLTLEAVLSGKASSVERFTETRPNTQPPQSQGPVQQTRPSGMPPTLKEIQEGKIQTDKNGTRDMRFVTAEEVSEEGEKRDILFKFKILRKQYKGATIPDFSEHTPLSTLKREYEQIVRQLALDSTVENYKKYLTIGFYVLEFVVGNFFRVEEIRGFATAQMVGMNQYERILFLIGEQSALSGRKPWPPIVQLIVAIMINGAIYVGGKFLMKATGLNIMGMMGQTAQPQQQPMQNPGPQGFTAFPQQHSHQGQSASRPGRMRQPDIDLDTITGKKND